MKTKNYNLTSEVSKTSSSFTVKYNETTTNLIIDCGISRYEHNQQINDLKPIVIKTLLDTGSCSTNITRLTANQLGLNKMEYRIVSSPGGSSKVKIHLVNIHLPNGMIIPTEITEGGDSTDFGLILGMDILSQGDFSVFNINSKTVFSFVLPLIQRKIPVSSILTGATTVALKDNRLEQTKSFLVSYNKIIREPIVNCELSAIEENKPYI